MADSTEFPAAFDVYDGADVTVAPDSHYAWVGAAFWATRFAVVGAVLTTVAVLDDSLPLVDALVGVPIMVGTPGLMMGIATSLFWRFWQGRVSYVVSDGNLMVRRGRKVLRRFPCADITRLDLDDAMTWKALLLRNWKTAPWPALVIDRKEWPTTRLLVGLQRQRAILLWGKDRAHRAEADLRRAVTLGGAKLIDTGDT